MVGAPKEEEMHVRPRDKLILIVAVVLGLAALSTGIAVAAGGGDASGPTVVSQEPGDDTNGSGQPDDDSGTGDDEGASDDEGAADDDGATDDSGANDESDGSLTGDTAAKASEAALAATGGGTVLAVESDDGDAGYEVEIRQADGGEAEVELDKNFKVAQRAED